MKKLASVLIVVGLVLSFVGVVFGQEGQITYDLQKDYTTVNLTYNPESNAFWGSGLSVNIYYQVPLHVISLRAIDIVGERETLKRYELISGRETILAIGYSEIFPRGTDDATIFGSSIKVESIPDLTGRFTVSYLESLLAWYKGIQEKYFKGITVDESYVKDMPAEKSFWCELSNDFHQFKFWHGDFRYIISGKSHRIDLYRQGKGDRGRLIFSILKNLDRPYEEEIEIYIAGEEAIEQAFTIVMNYESMVRRLKWSFRRSYLESVDANDISADIEWIFNQNEVIFAQLDLSALEGEIMEGGVVRILDKFCANPPVD